MKHHYLPILAIVVTTSCVVGSTEPAAATPRKQREAAQVAPRAQFNELRPAMGRDPYGVYVGGREIGRDPDPNVREELRNDYYVLQGPG